MNCNHERDKERPDALQFCTTCGNVYSHGSVIVGHQFLRWLENYFKDCGGWRTEEFRTIQQLLDAWEAGYEQCQDDYNDYLDKCDW